MGNLETTGLAIGLSAVLLLSACGEADPDTRTQPGTTEQTQTDIQAGAGSCITELASGYTPGGPLPTDDMEVNYITDIEAVDPGITELQKGLGSLAVSTGLTESFCVQIGDEISVVSLGLPEAASAREQQVILVTDSAKAGDVFGLLGLPELADSTVSATNYGVGFAPDGHIIREGVAISVVGQELDGVGAIHNVATERCQALDLEAEPVFLEEDLLIYGAVKEAVCNTLGAATDRAIVGIPYAEYVDEYRGKPTGSDINQSGETVLYPIVSEQQYDLIADVTTR